MRISCPDATGLGCDIARMLLDFGLRILTGDLSTDGTWCYLVFVVRAQTLSHTLALHAKPLPPTMPWLCLPTSAAEPCRSAAPPRWAFLPITELQSLGLSGLSCARMSE